MDRADHFEEVPLKDWALCRTLQKSAQGRFTNPDSKEVVKIALNRSLLIRHDQKSGQWSGAAQMSADFFGPLHAVVVPSGFVFTGQDHQQVKHVSPVIPLVKVLDNLQSDRVDLHEYIRLLRHFGSATVYA